jgi:DNA invertase Pin-like site-specific DNA recombinase
MTLDNERCLGTDTMASTRFVSYLRVSTAQQGRSGLGMEAQREAVRVYVSSAPGDLLSEFIEVESGKVNTRPQLAAALAQCRLTGATLVVAKLDRMARNARFLLSVVEGSGDGGVVFCDLPTVPPGPVGKFLVTQMAAVAELEAGLIGQRTRAALAAAKARGQSLGGWRGGLKVDPSVGRAAVQQRADTFASGVGPIAAALRKDGASLRDIAANLTAQGVRTPRGGAWSADAVSRLLGRFAEA